MKKVYLAGPDVFRRDAVTFGAGLKEILKNAEIEGLFPLDNEIEGGSPAETAREIRTANIQMIKECDGVIADLSPFRGPEPDSGTVWEVGFAQALGKPVIGYCTDRRTLKEKTVEMLGLAVDSERDNQDMLIEDFGLSHNLMYSDIVVCSSFEEAVKKIRQSLM